MDLIKVHYDKLLRHYFSKMQHEDICIPAARMVDFSRDESLIRALLNTPSSVGEEAILSAGMTDNFTGLLGVLYKAMGKDLTFLTLMALASSPNALNWILEYTRDNRQVLSSLLDELISDE